MHRVLGVRLSQLLGYEARIWRDQKLQGSDVFDEEITQQFIESKLLVSVLSPRYINSDWCKRELVEFWQKAEKQEEIQIGNKSRVFKIVKTPIENEELPPRIAELLSSLLGFEFYFVDPETGRVMEYDDALGESAQQKFFEKVYDLAHEMSSVLRSLRSESTGSGDRSEKVQKIYLAETTSDLREERNNLRRDLIERGFEVLPNSMIPLENPLCIETIQSYLEKADLSVHLVGNRYGLVPEDSSQSLVEIQNEMASKRSQSNGLNRVIWIPKGLSIQDERQRQLIHSLQEDKAFHQGAEIVEDSIENLKEFILELMKPKVAKAKPPEPQIQNSAGPKHIYIICETEDEEAIEPLEDFLHDQGLEVSLPDFEVEETENDPTHRRNLVDCDAVIVYYGSARKAWVDVKLREIMKAPGYGRTTPIAKQLVYIAPPIDRRKERFRSISASVIHQEGSELNAGALNEFVKQLKHV